MATKSKKSTAIKNQNNAVTPIPLSEKTEQKLPSVEVDLRTPHYDYFDDLIHENTGYWDCLDDIIQDIKYLEDDMKPFMRIAQMDDCSFRRAKQFIQAFLDHGSDFEIRAIYQLIKVHSMMMEKYLTEKYTKRSDAIPSK